MGTETKPEGDTPLSWWTNGRRDAGPTPPADPPLLRRDEQGNIRVRGTRVLLETIVAECDRGATPEAIAEAYDSISPDDARDVIQFYQTNYAWVRAYVEGQEEAAGEAWKRAKAAGLVSPIT